MAIDAENSGEWRLIRGNGCKLKVLLDIEPSGIMIVLNQTVEVAGVWSFLKDWLRRQTI